MLRKFLDVFFPGFGWEHGFALWDVGTALSVGGSILGGMMGDDAAEDAADAQSAAAAQAIAEVRKIGDRTRADTEPYRGLGIGSINRLNVLLGLGGTAGGGRNYAETPLTREEFIDARGYNRPDPGRPEGPDWLPSENANIDRAYQQYLKTLKTVDATTDPEYNALLREFGLADLEGDVVYNKGLKFGMDEGLKALERRQLALGGFDSGAAVKAATRFANDYGETKAAGAYERFMNDKAFTMNSLLGTTNVGQRAVETDANTGMQMATAIGGAQMGAGNARAAGIVGGSNAWGNAISGISNAYNTYRENQTLDKILDKFGG